MDENKQLPEGWRTWESPNKVTHAVPPTGPCATCGQAHPVQFTWKVVNYGERYETVGVPGGEWQLIFGTDVYLLRPAGSCRGAMISAANGLYYAIDLATEFIEEQVK
jgi:hypothetical protein